MKTFSLACILSFAASTLAQHIDIGAPAVGKHVKPGSKLEVMIERPNTNTASDEVAIVIALAMCPNSTCVDPDVALGDVLHTGPFDPRYDPDIPKLPPHQNFSVVVPSDFTGLAQLSVAHVALVGANFTPLYEIVKNTVEIS